MIVAYGCNRDWYKYLIINIFSLLRHNKEVKKIYILCEDNDINKIKDLDIIIDRYDIECKVINITPIINKYFKNKYNTNTKYTNYALSKLLLSEVVEEDKVLYLDVDTIIRSNISSLYKYNIDDYYAAGVKDYGGFLNNYNKDLGIDDMYINTGVILLNINKIKQDNLIPKFFNIINTRTLTYPDQDAFNIVCNNKILYISSMYNFAINNTFQVTRNVFNNKLRKIYHYTGNKSDWVADKFYAEEWYYEQEKFINEFKKNDNTKSLKVAFCCNKNFYKYLAININSLLNYNSNIDKIYLILEDDTIENIPYLDKVINNYTINYEVINFNNVKDNYLSKKSPNLNTVYSNFCFAKLLLSDLTKEDKIIYIDTDTIVKGDLSLLWYLELDEYYALGVKDYGVRDENNYYNYMNLNCKYINTGVMVLNLKKIREDKLVDKLFTQINSKEYKYPDQDAFNIVCNNKIGYIPSIFNCICKTTKEVSDYDKVKIFHFAGEKKYWATDKKHSEEYFIEYEEFKEKYNLPNLLPY